MKVSYNATTMKKSSLENGLSPDILVQVMKLYNDYVRTPDCSLEDKLLMFPDALIQWCERRVDDAAGKNVLVVAQLVKSSASAGKVTPTQILLALSIAKLTPEHAVFHERVFFMGDVKPEDVNNDFFPFDVQSAVPYDPKIAVSALVLQTIVQKKDRGEDYMPLLKEFVRNFRFSRGERACRNQKNTWGYYAMNSAISGTYTDPETDDKKKMKVDMVIPLAKSNADVEALFTLVEGYALATDILTHADYLKMKAEAKDLFMLLENKASKKRTRESSGRGAQEQEIAGGHLSEEEAEQEPFLYSDGNHFPDPIKKVLEEYLRKNHPLPAGAPEDAKLQKISLLRDPILAWFANLKGTPKQEKILPATIEGLVWMIECVFHMPNNMLPFLRDLPSDVQVVWQPEGVQPLSESAKTKLLVILQKVLFLADQKGESCIMFAYACLQNQPEVLSEAVNKVVSNGTCVDKLLNTIRVLDEPSRIRLRTSNSVYEFFYSLGWIFLRELVRKASEHWNKLLLSRRCIWENNVSFKEKGLLKTAMYENSDDNREIIMKVSLLLQDHVQRMAQKICLFDVNGTPVFAGVSYTDRDGDSTDIKGKLLVSAAMFSDWKQVFTTMESDDNTSKMQRIQPENKWHKLVVDSIESMALYNVDLPVQYLQLLNFYNEWSYELAVSIVQNFVIKDSVKELHGFDSEIMTVLDKYSPETVNTKTIVSQLLAEIGDTAYVKQHLGFLNNNIARGITFAGVLPVYEKLDPDDAASDVWIVQRINWFVVHEGKVKLNQRILHLSPDDLTLREDEKAMHLATHQPIDPFAPRPAQP